MLNPDCFLGVPLRGGLSATSPLRQLADVGFSLLSLTHLNDYTNLDL